jgi:hypothetical protein
MDEARFNTTIRKFLKEVGVTAQREIEKAVRERLRTGELPDHQSLKAVMTLRIEAVDLTHVVEGDIEVG